MQFQWIGLLILLALIPLLVVAVRLEPAAAAAGAAPAIRAWPWSATRCRAGPGSAATCPFALLASAVALLIVALARPSVVAERPDEPDDGHPHDRRVRQHVLDATSPRPGSQAAEDAAVAFVAEPEGRDPDRDRRVQRVRGRDPGADDRPERAHLAQSAR